MTEEMAEDNIWTLRAWLKGRVPVVGFRNDKHLRALGDDCILRLRLPARVEEPLLRSGIASISLLIEIANSPFRSRVRSVGDVGWRHIEAALSSPIPRGGDYEERR